MSTTSHHDERIAKMSFASVYPHYISKVEKKGRTKEELNLVITWLTGFNETQIEAQIKEKVSFEDFFNNATFLNKLRIGIIQKKKEFMIKSRLNYE